MSSGSCRSSVMVMSRFSSWRVSSPISFCKTVLPNTSTCCTRKRCAVVVSAGTSSVESGTSMLVTPGLASGLGMACDVRSSIVGSTVSVGVETDRSVLILAGVRVVSLFISLFISLGRSVVWPRAAKLSETIPGAIAPIHSPTLNPDSVKHRQNIVINRVL